MNNRSININEGLVIHYSNVDAKTLHVYTAVALLTAGYGYVSISDFINKVGDFCNISERTAWRWITRLKKRNLIKIKNNTIHVKGKHKLENDVETTKFNIRFCEEHLKSYSNFQAHCIRQVALLKQRRMSYGITKAKVKDSTSLVNSGVVETDLAVVKTGKKAGCSISQLTKTLGFDKSTISRALEGHTVKQFGTSYPIKGKIARIKYGSLLDAITRGEAPPQWSYSYSSRNDTYVLRYALASRIVTESFLTKK